jgi:hypothetical protein
MPGRLPLSYARLLFGLSALMLVFVALGFFLYDGWHRVAYMSAFFLIGLGNFVWALGSVLPEDERAVALRGATRPVSILMFVALALTLAFQFGIVR